MRLKLREHTLASAQLLLFSNGNEIGRASGFFYRVPNKIVLVSNWHVFSGRDCVTGQCLDRHGRIPDKITILYSEILSEEIRGKKIDLRINNIGDHESWGWCQHPQGQDFDIAWFDVTLLAPNVFCANDHSNYGPLIPEQDRAPEKAKPHRPLLRAATDVYIVGFPLGLRSHLQFALWRRGTVASEAELEEPFGYFFVDCWGGKGLSGSPVYFYSTGGVETDRGSTVIMLGGYIKFVGIYSGRMRSNVKSQIESCLEDSLLPIARVFNEIEVLRALSIATSPAYSVRPLGETV